MIIIYQNDRGILFNCQNSTGKSICKCVSSCNHYVIVIIRIENAILKRAENPLAFEPVKSNRDRKHPYYRIYVGNCIVFYVVIDDVIEVRRLMYRSRNIRERL